MVHVAGGGGRIAEVVAGDRATKHQVRLRLRIGKWSAVVEIGSPGFDRHRVV
jgi:hypothetical protein